VRVIAGEFRSRKLKSVPGLDTRPTPDRLRESLFSILAPRIEGAAFVDVYAGAGAVGIEALSRGASHAIFVERSRGALAVLRENLKSLGLHARATVVNAKAATALPQYARGIVFIDPPYESENEYLASLAAIAGSDADLVIVQHARRFDPGEAWGRFRRSRTVRQGDNALTFYVPEAGGEAETRSLRTASSTPLINDTDSSPEN
jgi:16S rRNA (guanine966-N2)-methyltransferase